MPRLSERWAIRRGSSGRFIRRHERQGRGLRDSRRRCDWLGYAVEEIAAEKAGIVKCVVPVGGARNEPSVVPASFFPHPFIISPIDGGGVFSIIIGILKLVKGEWMP